MNRINNTSISRVFAEFIMRTCYCVVLLMFCASQSQRTHLDDNIMLYRKFRRFTYDLIGRTSTRGGRALQNAIDQGKVQTEVAPDKPFPCNLTGTRSLNPPTSVHKVRPGDIDVVGAMGDSLTSAEGALGTNFFHLLIENRGLSSFGGGQGTWREYLTLPNILKEFNPNLIGYAEADSISIDYDTAFNLGEIAAMSKDMPFMAEILVQRLKHDPRVDIQNHWKLIQLMIGPNDFCSDMCYLSSPWMALQNHRSNLIQVLRTLRDNLPKTIVSLVLPPNLKVLVETTGKSLFCEILHYFECSCLFGYRWRHHREEFYKIMEMWQVLDEEIATMLEFRTDDFTIVTQPFTTNITLPKLPNGSTDWSYLSSDCFHFSQKGYARVSNALWNNIMEPVGQKTRDWDKVFKRFLCPTPERPYIATSGNR